MTIQANCLNCGARSVVSDADVVVHPNRALWLYCHCPHCDTDTGSQISFTQMYRLYGHVRMLDWSDFDEITDHVDPCSIDVWRHMVTLNGLPDEVVNRVMYAAAERILQLHAEGRLP